MVARDRLGDFAGELNRLVGRVARLEAGANLGFSSITRGSLRIASTEGLIVEGSARVSGSLNVTGTETVSGTLNVVGVLMGNGEIVWTGPASFTGDTDIGGTLDVTGNAKFTANTEIGGTLKVTGTTRLEAAVTLLNDLIVQGAGKIRVGTSMTLDPNAAAGSLLFSNGAVLEADSGGARLMSGGGPRVYAFPGSAGIQYSPTHFIQVTGTQVTIEGSTVVNGPFSASSKSFKIPHPVKPNMWLVHGSTESDAHGVEYWGDVVLDDEGSAVVELPDYFEALTLTERRSVLVTPRGFVADWTDIEDGAFRITGVAGGRVSWLVKAVRSDVTMVVEEPVLVDEGGD